MEGLFLVVVFSLVFSGLESSGADAKTKSNDRFVTYTVKYGEGFNLRRDVYMRVASLVLALRRETGFNWILVLPPWPRMYHWTSPVHQAWLPWSRFFDISELSEAVPCIEFSSYLETEGYIIDEVLHLQSLKDSFTKDGKFIEVAEESNDCVIEQTTSVFGHHNIKIKESSCVSAQGSVSVMVDFLKKRMSKRSFLIQNFENLLHKEFGGREYWKIRRSMVYSSILRSAGNHFMIDKLNYDPGESNNGRRPPKNEGGEYIGAHLRRRDFIDVHKASVPSLESAISQIKILMDEQNLTKVFVASDASTDTDFQEAMLSLRSETNGGVYWYQPSGNEIDRYGDGGVAIIDQWILSHARYFIGTAESTFSYRVREDRQFMGFTVESTFNNFCGHGHDDDCPQPTKWLLVEDVTTDDDHNLPKTTTRKLEL